MRSIEEIKEIKQFYTKDLYEQVRTEQTTDQGFYDDTFKVPEVKEPHQIYRSGLGVRIIDAPAEQIVTSNPQVFVEIGNKDTATKVSKLLNGKWVDLLHRQNPNPFKEGVKDSLLRGETFIRLVANPEWAFPKGTKTGLPICFIIPDPMIIFASPEEDENGIPEKVVVFYERRTNEIISAYPKWTNPKLKERNSLQNSKVEWFEFWDKDTRYVEADSEDVLGGVKPNPYGFVPFIRRYSGFGRRSPEGKLESLIVSDIRRSRDLLKEECAMRSNIASIQYLFAHKDILVTSSGELNAENIKEGMKLGASVVNILDQLPPDTKIELGLSKEMGQVSESSLQHHRDIIAELNQRHPFIMAGFPFGESGRQQEMVQSAAMRRYDSIVENSETMWATAFEKAFEMCRKLNIVPEGLNNSDFESEFKCVVNLKEKDPLEEDRLITLGEREWNGGNGSISLRTNLTKRKGMTDDEADEEIDEIFAERVLFTNPEIAALIGAKAVEKLGMEEELKILREQQKTQPPPALMGQPPASTQQRMSGETQTLSGREAIDMALANKGARTPPISYTRGQ